jgi:hypothetical protein
MLQVVTTKIVLCRINISTDKGAGVADLVAHWLAVLEICPLNPGKGMEKTELVFPFPRPNRAVKLEDSLPEKYKNGTDRYD